MGSGAIAVCFGTPFDVALVRMQADSMKPAESRRGYKNVVDALVRVYKEEGFMKLYRFVITDLTEKRCTHH
jgi:solute carrier family 25 oxoglutarate transporter 11